MHKICEGPVFSKRVLPLLVTAALCIGFSGCGTPQEKMPEETHPAAVPTDRNLCAVSSGCTMAQAEKGYYAVIDRVLYYADKENLSQWTAVCNNPACYHDYFNCPAYVGNGFTLRDGKLRSVREVPGTGSEGIYVMEPDGTGLSLEYEITESAAPDGGCLKHALIRNDYIYDAYSVLQPDGRFCNGIVRTDGKTTDQLFSGETMEMVGAPPLLSIQDFFSVRGDLTVISDMLSDGDSTGLQYFRFTGDGYEAVPGLAQYNQEELRGAYIRGDILNHFVPDDGYYRTQLTTGEMERRQDFRIPGSRAYQLTERYIVETNLYEGSACETPRMEIFDGNTWREVKFPADFQFDKKNGFSPRAISTEYIFFGLYENMDTRLYAVSLTDPECQLFPCGEFLAPEH